MINLRIVSGPDEPSRESEKNSLPDPGGSKKSGPLHENFKKRSIRYLKISKKARVAS